MAVALTFAIVILQSDQTGDAAFVDSDLNGFGEVAEARMLYFCVWYCCTGVYSARGKYFFQAIEEAMISLCNPRELMALSDLRTFAPKSSYAEILFIFPLELVHKVLTPKMKKKMGVTDFVPEKMAVEKCLNFDKSVIITRCSLLC